MVRSPKNNLVTLDDRFDFDESSFPVAAERWPSHLRAATGRADRERYLLRLFRKSGTSLDADLKRLIGRGIRRIRRVLSSRRARSILVEIIDVVEDDNEIAIVMLDPGSPISGTSRSSRARQDRLLSAAERKMFWRNLVRVAEAVTLCHDAGIVHGAIASRTIFSQHDDAEDYRLGGYEACIHIADGDLGGVSGMLGTTAVSFRQDWIDLARVAKEILGLDQNRGPSLLSIERRMLDRLSSPPQFQLFNGHVVLRELRQVLDELGRIGSSPEGELVLYPSGQVMRSDLSALSSNTIAAEDTDALLRFVEADLSSPDIRIAPGPEVVRLVTDLAIYGVKAVEPSIGSILWANKRSAEDWSALEAIELGHRLHLSRSRAEANDRVRRLGQGARPWGQPFDQTTAVALPTDVPTWYALILLETFSLLREQLRVYPVQVSRDFKERGIVWVTSVEDKARDGRRDRLGLHAAAEALKRELKDDDGKTGWILSRTDQLGAEKERRPELTYEGRGVFNGQPAYAFATTDTVAAEQYHFLRPKADGGFEPAVERRLRNIVAARTNVELLRALNDPSQVALDDALREIAKPGAPPDEMDKSKKAAWEAISAGRSVNVVVGPPGVGKTYLISQLIKSILSHTSDARILVSAQNHDTLAHMEDELRKDLPAQSTILVRVERSSATDQESSLRENSRSLLQSVSVTDADLRAFTANQHRRVRQALQPVDRAEQAAADKVYRDTDNLLLASADVTLATTSSHVIEEMIADGEQFDWVIVEEAARANGAELVGALLLGNRRVLIGDHNQLSPFDAAQRQKFYAVERADELLSGARQKLESFSDLPPEVDAALEKLGSDRDLLVDVLAIAARMEEPFRSIAEREASREKESGEPSSFTNMLLEQSRMHPAIGDIVSKTFYQGRLSHSDRVLSRDAVVRSVGNFPASPVVVLNLPALSTTSRSSFEKSQKKSLGNEVEAAALLSALKRLRPVSSQDGRRPTLAILSPYSGQVGILERLFKSQINEATRTLAGFASSREDGGFVFTSDSFQGSEADVVLASLVRNNALVGSRALGFVRIPQRVNVLLSRARHKLVLATSLQFIADAVDGTDPDRLGGELSFLRTMLSEILSLTNRSAKGLGPAASILEVDERGRFGG